MRETVDTGRQRWQQLRRDLGQRLSQRLFDELHLARLDQTRGGARFRSRSFWMACLLATVVHLTGVALGAAGLALLLAPWSSLFDAFTTLLLLTLGWLSRPRFASPPHYLVAESDYPLLFRVTRHIGERLRSPPLAGIEGSAEFGASYLTAGWRGQRFVRLGAPLLAILDRSERLALIAHEMAHGANGDPMRGMYLFGAVDSLVNWADAIRPTTIGHAGAGAPFGPIISLLAIPFEWVLVLLSECLVGAAKGLVLLVLRDSQRAEYLADQLAAGVAGSEAMIGLLEKSYLAEDMQRVSRQLALSHPTAALEPQLAQACSRVPAETIERYRQRSAAELWQVDSTHPPTAMRVAMLKAHPEPSSFDALSADDGRRFDEEVSRLIAWRQREILNRSREAAHLHHASDRVAT